MAYDALRTASLLDLSHSLAGDWLSDCEYPWLALPDLRAFVLALGARLPKGEYQELAPEVWVAADAVVAASASLTGPCVIDHGAEIRHCAFIRGSAIVGREAVVGNSTELKNTLLFDRAQVPHFNYVGDSILGYRAHMGAGAITSNVRSDKGPVVIHVAEGRVETGMRKFGAVLGDDVEIGCNSVLCPGTIIGRGSIVYPTSCVRGVVPARHIHKLGGAVVPMREEA
ncbi:UDP-N-acetylglucosamine pyrophosphorylase [Eubacteriales bacterium OttesenSCG-928-A19]|nr:UDP-N-acetylglucosamine pyrophosphorylase [Eubacteriales bacterium OttesenSCG-928-A19]